MCQEVCPWNKNIKPNTHPEFTIDDEEMANMTREDWESLTEEQFNKLFKKTSVKG